MSGLLRAGPYGSSPLNFTTDRTASEHFASEVTLVDVTLREGQQAAEVAFGPDDEIAFARALQAAGVRVVQVGYAGNDDPSIRRIRDACPDLQLMALLVGWKVDAEEALRSAREAGADICSILFRSADAHLDAIGYTRETARSRVEHLAVAARDAGYPTVVYGPSFASQADPEYLLGMYRAAVAAGAQVVSFADSLGVLKPEAVAAMVGRIRDAVGEASIRLHMHDDYGLALANTIAGLGAGADWAEVSVLGLGERAGNCALEELVIALEGLYGIRTGVDGTKLGDLCRLVASVTGVAIPDMKPVAGANTFANKLEIHLQAVAADPTLMEPFDPALVGNKRTIKLGRGTGPTGVRLRAAQLGQSVPDDRLPQVASEVNRLAIEHKRAVTDDEFRALLEAS
jgi:isopropylmalate/homocitrate/citramalate synthase